MNGNRNMGRINILSKVSGNISCTGRDVYKPDPESKLVYGFGRAGRVIGVTGSCLTCGGCQIKSQKIQTKW